MTELSYAEEVCTSEEDNYEPYIKKSKPCPQCGVATIELGCHAPCPSCGFGFT